MLMECENTQFNRNTQITKNQAILSAKLNRLVQVQVIKSYQPTFFHREREYVDTSNPGKLTIVTV